VPNMTVWIRNPYPLRWEEIKAIQEAVKRVYAVQMVYFYGLHNQNLWYDYAHLNNVSMTTAKQIALLLRVFHLQLALQDYRRDSRVNAEDVEVEVRGRLDERPSWASIE
jgi:hypothetical protein